MPTIPGPEKATEDFMLKRLTFLVSIAAMGATLACAQQSTVQIPIQGTRPTDGKQMFVSYCAPCHGLDGRGNGPVAVALKTSPADLTVLARKNHGTYPAEHVAAVLNFGVKMPAHGTSEMPVWGPLLSNLNYHGGNGQQFETLRVNNLVRYIETLQTK